jgi:nicotinamide riboside kinase
VALVGPESTGKTTLAARLAAVFDGEWSAESARLYVDARRSGGAARALGPGDVDRIAHRQIALEDAAAARARAAGRRLVVRDTDLVSTVVYARHYYGRCPEWIVRAAAARRAGLYLLLAPDDLPWAPDPVRDTAAARAALAPEFWRVLAELGGDAAELRGGWAARAAAARDLVAKFLARG